MGEGFKIEVKDGDIPDSLRDFLRLILSNEEIDAVLTPLHLPDKTAVMPALVADPERLDAADPLSPAFPLNAARLASRLSRQASGGKVAVVLRPCEIRAFIELIKLKQGSRDELVIIGLDCLGALTNTDFNRTADDANLTGRFYQSALGGRVEEDGFRLAPACLVCEHITPEQADIMVGLYGQEPGGGLFVKPLTRTGEKAMEGLKLAPSPEPGGRKKAIESLVARRVQARDEMFAATEEATDNLEKLTTYLASCVNCYNCRVACPVCYCRECVFTTDVFDHDPAQYLRWAVRKGVVKMPTDTVFYHLTRLAHMSTACVGCGQCSNACPNDIPVMEIFRTVSHKTQRSFGYLAGRSLDEAPPLSVFREDEFREVVGL